MAVVALEIQRREPVLRTMVGERHLLEEDGAAVVERAGRLWGFIHSAAGPLP